MTQIAQTISQLDAATPVERLEGITLDEVAKLEAKGILTIGHLWARMGGDEMKLSDLDILAAETKLSSDRLIELLPSSLIDTLQAELLHRADYLNLRLPASTSTGAIWDRSAASAWERISILFRKTGPWFRQHLLDWVVFIFLLGFAFLIFRAAGAFDSYPSPLGLSHGVVVTRRDLRAGEVLHIERDLSQARLPLKDTYFVSTSGLEGLILTRDVSSQKPLSFGDLLRYQVVTTKNIAEGETIANDAVMLAWSPYNPKALTQTEQATNRKTKSAIRKDNVVLSDAVAP